MSNDRNMRRGAYQRSDCQFLGVWVPQEWVAAIDLVVRQEDTDRSKFVRRALQERIQQLKPTS